MSGEPLCLPSNLVLVVLAGQECVFKSEESDFAMRRIWQGPELIACPSSSLAAQLVHLLLIVCQLANGFALRSLQSVAEIHSLTDVS